MHQPLHCSDNQDKGGNYREGAVRRTAGRTCTACGTAACFRACRNEEQLFAASWQRTRKRTSGKWSQGTVEDWAEESHKRRAEGSVRAAADGAAGPALVIRAAYEKGADPLIRRQIEKAGARLAAV